MKLCSGYSIRTKLTALILMVVSAIVLVLSGSSMAAVDGDLDSTFGSGGKVVTDFFGRSSGANAIALQADGKMVVAGNALSALGPPDFALARYNRDGSLDSSFGSGGRVTTDFGGRSDNASAVAHRVGTAPEAASTSARFAPSSIELSSSASTVGVGVTIMKI